jgi:hypothetical protein
MVQQLLLLLLSLQQLDQQLLLMRAMHNVLFTAIGP